MMLIVYKHEGIRIVIGTANMIEQDWCNKTNAHYLQDFPLKSHAEKGNTHNISPFEVTLTRYCNSVRGMAGRVVMDFSFLHQYDFSSAKVRLIPSVPGYHRGDAMRYFGHQRLQQLLESHHVVEAKSRDQCHDSNSISTSTSTELVINISSFGSLKEQWLTDEFVHGALHGDCSETENEGKFKILWPTVDDVRNSIEGYSAGGSLCFSQKNCKPFLRQFIYRWNGSVSGRSRLMPHIKSYSCIDSKHHKLKWFVLSSANLSTAAWGQLQKNKSQLFIRSFEMGCLYVPEVYAEYLNHRHRGFYLTDLPGQGIRRNLNPKQYGRRMDGNGEQMEFEMVYQQQEEVNGNKLRVQFPIPMKVVDGVERYKHSDRPWVWDLRYEDPDLYGSCWPHASDK